LFCGRQKWREYSTYPSTLPEREAQIAARFPYALVVGMLLTSPMPAALLRVCQPYTAAGDSAYPHQAIEVPPVKAQMSTS